MAHLRLIKSSASQSAPSKLEASPSVINSALVGHPYKFKRKPADEIGLEAIAGNYAISNRKGEVTPPHNHQDGFVEGYFWQNDLSGEQLHALHVKDMENQPIADGHKILANRALLQSSKLIGPDILTLGGRPTLSISPEFIVHFSTDAGAAELGEIRLIDSSRFITLTSGKTIPIICTDPAEGQALFLNQGQPSPVATQQFVQPPQTNETYVIRKSVNQYLPNLFNGEKVAYVTVLEHITSYFMQRLSAPTNSIWTPVLHPISWGWSVRAEQQNADWSITKRKVMRPTVHHDGLELPTWTTHIAEQSDDEWQYFLNHNVSYNQAVSAPFDESIDFVN